MCFDMVYDANANKLSNMCNSEQGENGFSERVPRNSEEMQYAFSTHPSFMKERTAHGFSIELNLRWRGLSFLETVKMD